MAQSKRTRTAAVRTTGNGPVRHPKPGYCNDPNIELTKESIDRQWNVLPPQAKKFIMDSPDGMLPVSTLINFWSSPQNIEFTRGYLAGNSNICGASWYLALVYLKMRMWKEARALTVNGAFIHECHNSSIEYIKKVCQPGGVITEHQFPCFVRGCGSIRSPDTNMMKSFIRSYFPEESTHMMTLLANMYSQKGVMGFVDKISDGWKGASSASRDGDHRSSSTNDDTLLKLILVDDTNEDERHSFNIGSSTTLKALFNDYADKRGIPLRSLRYSYAGKTLFLSSAGHKTPEELGMRDQDVIMAHDTSKPQESSDGNSSSQQTPTSEKPKAKKRSNKKAKGKSKKPQQHEEPIKTLEEYKVQHSKLLTKIHEEAQAQFKQIRQRLNNLVIERSQPKFKSKRPHTPNNEPSLPFLVNNPSKEGLGGKAGKSYYAVQVGEVQNLYKTTKPSAIVSHFSSPSKLLKLDLHGCTRLEALMKLDESLKIWVDIAMQGLYPFVQQAVIVCGCGNQMLSETVQEWIRSNDKVSNAPKVRSCRK